MPIEDAILAVDDPGLWLELGDEVKRLLAPIVGEIVGDGFNAVLDVAAGITFTGAPDPLVLAATADYLDAWWIQLSRVRRDSLRAALIAMQRGELEGTGVRALTRELAPLFGPERAALIAETETTRMFAIGAEASYQALGITEYVWETAEDDLVDPICRDRNQRRFPVRQGPLPPAHPRCRCTTAPVESGRVLEAV